MKKFFLLCIIILCCGMVDSALASSQALHLAVSAPDSPQITKYKLVEYLTRSADSDYQKLENIAYWIATHIAYDDYKYNGSVNFKEAKYQYDTFKYRTGICTDFANLFKDLADIANISGVEVVGGYVVKTDRIKRSYKRKEIPEVGHAWNKVTLDGRKFFVDTTYMSHTFLRDGTSRKISSFNHKIDVKSNKRKHTVNTEVNDFYFDFTPKKELKKYNRIHLLDKYVK